MNVMSFILKNINLNILMLKRFATSHWLFSSYASALELTLRQFQLFETYVLGDEQRERYINNFIQNKYKYVMTIKPSF